MKNLPKQKINPVRDSKGQKTSRIQGISNGVKKIQAINLIPDPKLPPTQQDFRETFQWRIFRIMAEGDNRTLSNFIETSVLRFIENSGYIDEYEMAEIHTNKYLNQSIKRGLQDAKLKKG